MYNDIYDLPKPKVEITLTKALVILNTLLITLVIPILGITYYKANKDSFIENQKKLAQQVRDQSGGRVAGISTSDNVIKLPLLNTIVDLNSQTGIMILVGLGLIGFAVILFIYLLVDSVKQKKYIGKLKYH